MSAPPSSSDMKKIPPEYFQYIESIRDAVSDDKFHDFLRSMHLFKHNMISFDILAARIETLFKNHPQLIHGFNAFIPEPHVVEDEKQRVGKFAGFIQTLKDRFAHDPRVFNLFTGIMRRCRCKEGMSVHEARREVKELIKDHRDLLEQFDRILPGERVATGYPHRQWYGKLRVNPGDRAAEIGYGNKREQTCDLRLEHNLRDGDLELEEHRKGGQSENNWIEHVNRIKRERKRSRKSEGHPVSVQLHQGGKSGKNFKLHNIPRSSCSDKNYSKGLYTQEDNSCNKVEEKLPNDIYHKLLELHHMYGEEGKSTDALDDKFRGIVAKYPKLMERFSCDMMQCENIEGFLAGLFAKETLRKGRYIAGPIKVSEMQTDRECYSIERQRQGDSEKERGKDKKRFDGTCSSFLKHAGVTERVDHLKCQRENPSYFFRPKNNSTLLASGTLPGDASVLNDVLVSVPSGRDHTYIKQINQYEETLFRCEDDRYEMDMLMESVKSTTRRVEDFLMKIKDQSIEPDEIEVGKHLNSSNLRCIEVLYDEHGLSVIDMLHKSARLVLPVILSRLKQKTEELSSCYSTFDKVWTEIFSDNYHKSLGHDGLYFKPQDTNNSSEKGSDIKGDDATSADLDESIEAEKHNDNACMESETNVPSG